MQNSVVNGHVQPRRQSLLMSWMYKQQLALIIGTLLLTSLIAASWLVFPYFIKGQHLLSDVGGSVKQEKIVKFDLYRTLSNSINIWSGRSPG